MKKRLLSVLLLLALALSLLPTTALAGNDLTGFTDAASISSDALPAMQWAVAQAIIRGDSFRLNPRFGVRDAPPLLCNLNLFGPERRFLPIHLTKNRADTSFVSARFFVLYFCNYPFVGS